MANFGVGESLTTSASSMWWGLVLLTIMSFLQVLNASDPTDLSRCPPHLARTRYLRAAHDWDMCYEFHLEERTWRTALTLCGRRGGTLVTIQEARIQSFLMRSLVSYRWPRNGVWIGATDKDEEMKWKWITGELVSDGYSKWGRGQPSCGFLCFEDCALLRWREGGRWHDYRCNWLEDYSFICQFDMVPPPTSPPTTTTTTTTTAATTTTTTTPPTTTITTTSSTAKPTPVFISHSSSKLNSTDKLRADYRLHQETQGEGGENETTVLVMPPSVLAAGSDARVGEVRHMDTSDHSQGLSTGAVTGLVLGILLGLSAAICLMVFLLLGRRRRKHKREEDPGISYHNPYYGEVKPRPAARRDSGTDYEEEEEDVGYLANDFSLHGLLDMYGAGAVGGATESEVNKKLLVAPEKSEKGVGSTSLKEPPPPSPLHVRPKCVMNTYDTPPSLASHRPAAVAAATKKHKSPHAKLSAGCELPDKKKKKRGNGRDGKKKEEEVEEENYYDEVGPMAPTAYDVPPVGGRRAHHMATARLPLLPKTTATTTNKSSSSSSFPPRVSSPSFPPCAEDLYYNDQDEEMEENVYESVENLREAIGQQRGVLQLHNEALVGAAHGGATGVEGGNLYVPFVLDEVKDQ